MENASLHMKFFIILLIASSITFSMVPGARGLQCKSEEDCKAFVCEGGTPHCGFNGKCQCFDVQIDTSCSNGFHCDKKCDSKCKGNSCVNGQCECGCV